MAVGALDQTQIAVHLRVTRDDMVVPGIFVENDPTDEVLPGRGDVQQNGAIGSSHSRRSVNVVPRCAAWRAMLFKMALLPCARRGGPDQGGPTRKFAAALLVGNSGRRVVRTEP